MTTRENINKIVGNILVGIMGFMVINVIWQVFTRYVLNSPSSVTDELARYLLIWLGVLGAAYVSGQKKHIAIHILPNKLSEAAKRKLEFLIAIIIIVFALLAFVIGGTHLMYLTFLLKQNSAALGIPMGFVYAIIPISGLLIVYYKISDLNSSAL